jgi:hypothetical protein
VHLFFTSEYNGCVCLCRVPPRVCVYNSFFYQKLLTSGYEGVRRWKNKIDWFEYDIIIIPVNYFQSHWCAHDPLANSFYSGKAGSMACVVQTCSLLVHYLLSSGLNILCQVDFDVGPNCVIPFFS